jgi:hypothetical protein
VRRATRSQPPTRVLDIGTGIPAANNTHEVAQAVTPAARVVYVDYDPVVLQARCWYNSLARETQQHRTQAEVTRPAASDGRLSATS